MAKKLRKPKVKRLVLAPGEAAVVKVPRGHTPLVSPEAQHVEIVPVKKKKGWWETLLYGD